MARIPKPDPTECMYLSGLAYQEIARLLGKADQTIARRLYALGYKHLRSTAQPPGAALRKIIHAEAVASKAGRARRRRAGVPSRGYYAGLSRLE